jgi:hypothetical protein
VFIDEAWTATNMTRSFGHFRKGERLRMGHPHGDCKTTTLVAVFRLSAMVVPMVLDWSINVDWFEDYVTSVLVPELKLRVIVVIDKLSSHKQVAIFLASIGNRSSVSR